MRGIAPTKLCEPLRNVRNCVVIKVALIRGRTTPGRTPNNAPPANVSVFKPSTCTVPGSTRNASCTLKRSGVLPSKTLGAVTDALEGVDAATGTVVFGCTPGSPAGWSSFSNVNAVTCAMASTTSSHRVERAVHALAAAPSSCKETRPSRPAVSCSMFTDSLTVAWLRRVSAPTALTLSPRAATASSNTSALGHPAGATYCTLLACAHVFKTESWTTTASKPSRYTDRVMQANVGHRRLWSKKRSLASKRGSYMRAIGWSARPIFQAVNLNVEESRRAAARQAGAPVARVRPWCLSAPTTEEQRVAETTCFPNKPMPGKSVYEVTEPLHRNPNVNCANGVDAVGASTPKPDNPNPTRGRLLAKVPRLRTQFL